MAVTLAPHVRGAIQKPVSLRGEAIIRGIPQGPRKAEGAEGAAQEWGKAAPGAPPPTAFPRPGSS